MSSNMPNLRKLNFTPDANPFLAPVTVHIDANAKRRYVRTATSQELADPITGEIKAISMIHLVEEKDDAEFVKVFAEGVKAAFSLSTTAAKVFRAVLDVYQKEKMTGGYADSVRLFWFGDGLDGAAIDMSEKTFQRGLKELLSKEFLMPRSPNFYWVNPSLFFKGDRVAFIREYRKKSVPTSLDKSIQE